MFGGILQFFKPSGVIHGSILVPYQFVSIKPIVLKSKSFFNFCLGFWAIFTRFHVRCDLNCELSDLPKQKFIFSVPLKSIRISGVETRKCEFLCGPFCQVRSDKKLTLVNDGNRQ